MYDPAAIEPWPSFYDKLDNKPYIQRQQRMTWNVQGWRWSDWAQTVAYYHGEISRLDYHIGRVLDVLAETGLDEQTLVIYTTDQGDLCGGHGMMDKYFVMYDDVMRVPLIMRWPEVCGEGIDCDTFVTNEIDIASTICAAAEIMPPPIRLLEAI